MEGGVKHICRNFRASGALRVLMPALSDPPISAIAMRLIEAAARSNGLITIARSESRATELHQAVSSLSKSVPTVLLPPWDCLPYDRASPSKEAMGARLSALRELQALGEQPFLLITMPDAVLQRLPRGTALTEVKRVSIGQRLDARALERDLLRAGYVGDERVDEPGEIAIRSQVLEVYPSSEPRPFRIDIDDGAVEGIRIFDPATQRTITEANNLEIGPASEIVSLPPEKRVPGLEHWLPCFYPELETLFDVLPRAPIYLEPGAEARAAAFLSIVSEGYRDRLRFHNASEDQGRTPLEPRSLYLTSDEFSRAAGKNRCELDVSGLEATPAFALEKTPLRSLTAFLKTQIEKNRRILLVAEVESDLKRMANAALRAWPAHVITVAFLEEAKDAEAGSILALLAPIRQGCLDLHDNLALIAAADVFGTKARRRKDAFSAAC
jgi:transcription-repair coupling factor (superfamily II helicase)